MTWRMHIPNICSILILPRFMRTVNSKFPKFQISNFKFQRWDPQSLAMESICVPPRMIHEPNANGAKPCRGKIAGSPRLNRQPCGIYYYFGLHSSCQQLEPYGSWAAWLRYPPKVSITMWQSVGVYWALFSTWVWSIGSLYICTGWTACVSAF